MPASATHRSLSSAAARPDEGAIIDIDKMNGMYDHPDSVNLRVEVTRQKTGITVPLGLRKPLGDDSPAPSRPTTGASALASCVPTSNASSVA